MKFSETIISMTNVSDRKTLKEESIPAVAVFKTNVQHRELADQLIATLLVHFPGCMINFDLEDCDRILRIEGMNLNCDQVIELLATRGFYCSALE